MIRRKDKVKNTSVHIRLGIYAVIIIVTLLFLFWISKMAYRNTALELEKEYIQTLAEECVTNIETSIRYGKELSNYYGLDEELRTISGYQNQGIGVVVTDADTEMITAVFGDKEDESNQTAYNKDMLTWLYAYLGQEQNAEFEKNVYAKEVSMGSYDGIIYEISDSEGGIEGYLFVLYDSGTLVDVSDVSLLSLSSDYEKMIQQSVSNTQQHVQEEIDALMDKGLGTSEIAELSEHFDEVAARNDAVSEITIANDGTVTAQLDLTYVHEKQKYFLMYLVAIIIICIIIGVEFTNLIPAILDKIHKRRQHKQSYYTKKGIGGSIRVLSFVMYTAIYISMPYAAIVMRQNNMRVFSLSESLSSSLPLTVELIAVLVVSLIVQRIYANKNPYVLMGAAAVMLIVGNLACAGVSSPYMLILLRMFCGIGFAFLKYVFNSLVSLGSDSDTDVKEHFAGLNAGLLGGITVGSSLGSILAGVFGYLGNYLFTGVIILIVFALSPIFVAWKELNDKRAYQVVETKQSISLIEVLRNRQYRWVIILTDIPLNIGLMYVVAFLPVYMGIIGQQSIVTSYAYLVNGIAGLYMGVWLVKRLKKLHKNKAVAVAIFMGAAGFLVLLIGKSAIVVLISAVILGVFDGFGTPTLTGNFASMGEKNKDDKAALLTIYGSIGSAVQIICPALYGVLANSEGDMIPMTIFGAIYAMFGVVFLIFGALFLKEEKYER
ncbi:Predicted arabinose efflux permease, MFS family [Eubacterium oxidoreducens]|uniref:Predicted arabinose efflux permease, MFS family n=1 Tax=Eubacterium oxidoreducens TaxID=1732 RepID=A0A1G6AAE9_EUBOX|nr:Predicted arabinose efflux permease, MFS family [Eubacterium oxidoreducens]